MEKAPFYNGSLIRSINLQGDELRDFLSVHTKGMIVQYDAYTSFGTQKGYGIDDTVRIYIEKSTHGRDIRKWNPQENEVLYQRGATFKILELVEKDGVYWILAEESAL